MKWMLLALILGTIPVKADLLFDNVEDCLKAEDTMRKEYARVYEAGTHGPRPIRRKPKIPIARNLCDAGTAWKPRHCIPHAAPATSPN
jgi:hypothetical protein